MKDFSALSKSIRKNILSMIFEAGSGHPGGSLGMTDVFVALYFEVMKHDPSNPSWEDRDYLILSAGHICPVWYATLAEAGYFDKNLLASLRKFGSLLQGHPHFEKNKSLPGVENSAGPLGQGLSTACGLAEALKLDKKQNQIYAVLSDGEQNEGQTMEAMMYAGSRRLGNITALIDRNGVQLSGNTANIMPQEPLARRIRAFKWHVTQVDGHDIGEIINACNLAKLHTTRPTAIICHTIPGKGVSFMENKYEWHGKAPNQEQFDQGMMELENL